MNVLLAVLIFLSSVVSASSVVSCNLSALKNAEVILLYAGKECEGTITRNIANSSYLSSRSQAILIDAVREDFANIPLQQVQAVAYLKDYISACSTHSYLHVLQNPWLKDIDYNCDSD